MPRRIELQTILRLLITNRDNSEFVWLANKWEFGDFCISYFQDIGLGKLEGQVVEENRYSVRHSVFNESDDYVIFEPIAQDLAPPPAKSRLFAHIPIAYPEDLPHAISTILENNNPSMEFEIELLRSGVGLHMSLHESLIVVNTLAAKHAEIRGGAWSGLGKRLELPLMLTLAKLYHVPANHYAGKGLTGESREVDFHFLSASGQQFFCEVKLMGKGNPESADSAIARRSNIFIAQTLSDNNKHQLTNRGHHWIELGAPDGYKRMHTVFNYLDVPCAPFHGDLDSALDIIIPQVFEEISL